MERPRVSGDEERRRADDVARAQRSPRRGSGGRLGRSARSRSARRSSPGPHETSGTMPRSRMRPRATCAKRSSPQAFSARPAPGWRSTKGRGTEARKASASGVGTPARYEASGALRADRRSASARAATRFRSTTCGRSAAGTTGTEQSTSGRRLPARAGARSRSRASRPPARRAADFQSPWASIENPGANSRISRRSRPEAAAGLEGPRVPPPAPACPRRRSGRRSDCPREGPRTFVPRPTRPSRRTARAFSASGSA